MSLDNLAPNIIEERYVNLLERQKMTRTRLINYHGFDKGHLSKILRGVTYPQVNTLNKLANALGMKLGELAEAIYASSSVLDKPSQDGSVTDSQGNSLESQSVKWQIKLQGELNSLTLQGFMRVQGEIRQLGGENQMAIDVREGCILMEFEGSLDGFEQIKALVQSGKLKELADFDILDVGLVNETSSLVNLRDWLQGAFEDGWMLIEQLLTPQQLAPSVFSGEQQAKIERAKQYQLGDYQINLVVEVTQRNEDEVAIALKVYPIGTKTQIYLPANLRLTISADGKDLPTITSREQTRLMQKLIDADFGDQFTLTLTLDDNMLTEEFEV